VSPLSTFVEATINSAGAVCVAQLTSGGTLETVKLCPSIRGSKMEYPVTVWKVVIAFVFENYRFRYLLSSITFIINY